MGQEGGSWGRREGRGAGGRVMGRCQSCTVTSIQVEILQRSATKHISIHRDYKLPLEGAIACRSHARGK